MIKTSGLLAALAVLGIALSGCGSSDATQPAGTTSTLQWTLTGLETLGPGFEYEGWLIIEGMPISTGRFGIDAGGVPSLTMTTLTPAMAAAATTFVLTIEPMPDPDPGPSATKVLGGDFNAGQATLGVDHAAALATDFMTAMGAFILATPSSNVMTDETQGIWWLDPGMGVASLQLPALPAGWSYEGWVVGGGGPVSTGRFTSASGADSDMAGPARGPDGNGPPFPGQDFVVPAMDLVGTAAVISVEPEPDDSPGPFALKPLLTPVTSAAVAPTLQAMMNNAAATNPTGTATIN